jgi:raffinose/stachyose/melibiose transport system substrate-binding protein
MKLRTLATRTALALGGTAMLAASLTACSSGLGGGSTSGSSDKAATSSGKLTGDVTITLLAGGNDPVAIATAKQYATGFHKAEPKVTLKVDTRPAGTDGDNLIKTKLSTGDMSDVFLYNSGSLLQALNPDTTLQPVTSEPWVKNITDDFKTTVSTSKGVYGAPTGTSFAGGILYNKQVYADLGLKVPTSWDEFIANSKKIKAAGKTAVLQTYGDTWTSQLFVLGSFANITASNTDWAKQYTDNDATAKYSKSPAIEGFDHTQQIHDLGLVNKDYASLTNANGLKDLATGDAVQYPMLGAVIGNVLQSNPDKVNDIGVFPIPADNAADTRLTIWEPNAAYIPKTTTGQKLIAAKKFLAWLNSPAGCAIQNKTGLPSGPYAINQCTVPSSAPALVADTQKYIDEKKAGVALEFLSPIKGPNLEKILIQVGSGISTAKQGAALYDDDVKKQAQQLGLKAWN